MYIYMNDQLAVHTYLQAKQFTIIHEVLGDTKLNQLNEQERRSLAFLTRQSVGTPR